MISEFTVPFPYVINATNDFNFYITFVLNLRMYVFREKKSFILATEQIIAIMIKGNNIIRIRFSSGKKSQLTKIKAIISNLYSVLGFINNCHIAIMPQYLLLINFCLRNRYFALRSFYPASQRSSYFHNKSLYKGKSKLHIFSTINILYS